MDLHNSIALFGLFIIFLGLGLLIYASLLGLILRFHLQLFPKIHAKLTQLGIKHNDTTQEILTMQTTESPIKQFNREPLPEHSNVFSPKCQNLLNSPRYKRTNHGTQFVYSCPECSAEFAFVPVTEFRLFEVIPQ